MLVAVFSDTHSNTAKMCRAVRETKPDALIHLGDYDRDALILRREFPELPLYSVCGNCDIEPVAPERLVVELGPIKAFLTHGHLYQVHYGRIDSLVYAAQEAGAQLALFGHTHEALYQELGGVQVLNPGSAGKGWRQSWATVEIFDNGGFLCQIRPF